LRFGRILVWDEGAGYTFSDLSRHGGQTGFPHVFFVAIEPLTGTAEEARNELGSAAAQPLARLTIRVRGKWTCRIVPLWLGRLWAWLVCREHARLLKKAL